MNLLALVTFLRTSILDDTGGTGVEWEGIGREDDDADMLRWSNEELVEFIDEAVRQVYRRILPVKDSSLDIAITAGVSTYILNPKIIQLLRTRLTSTGLALNEVDINDLWDISDWESKTGTPTCFTPNYDTATITLFPIPEIDDTLKILVNRYPLVDLSWSKNTALVGLRQEVLLPMLNYAAFMAYNKDEENTSDAAIANRFLDLFTRDFPHSSLYADSRKRRTTNRGIAYGGLRQNSLDARRGRYGSTGRDPYY